MNKRKQRNWFPRGYQHPRNSTLKSRLRDLLRNKPREEKEEKSSPQLSDENPRTSLPTSSSSSVRKTTTHEDIQKQDKKKMKLKKILNKFRLEISKHEKSVSNSFEADPYVVRASYRSSRTHTSHISITERDDGFPSGNLCVSPCGTFVVV